MNEKEFLEITSKLEKYFEKNYSTEQIKIMYDELKNISAERYRQIVTNIIRTSKYIPKIADIIEMNNTLPKTKKVENIDLKDCPKCNNTGIILYNKKIDGSDYVYAAACDYCNRGVRYESKGYYIPKAKEIGL